jgi:hypothetical protein
MSLTHLSRSSGRAGSGRIPTALRVLYGPSESGLRGKGYASTIHSVSESTMWCGVRGRGSVLPPAGQCYAGILRYQPARRSGLVVVYFTWGLTLKLPRPCRTISSLSGQACHYVISQTRSGRRYLSVDESVSRPCGSTLYIIQDDSADWERGAADMKMSTQMRGSLLRCTTQLTSISRSMTFRVQLECLGASLIC